MIALRCANCGAPLEVADHESLVQCRYCQATTRVRDRTLHLAVPVAPPTAVPQWVPPPAPAPWPSAVQRRPVARRAPRVGPMVAAVIGFGGVAAAAISVLQHSPGGVFSALAAMAPAPVMSACLVDANGDAALDVATLRSSGDTYFPELFDGSTGVSRWRGEAVPSGTKFYCVGHHLVLGLPDFTTHIHDARSPVTPLVVRGGDVTQAVRQGTGCLDLEAADHSHLAVAVDGSNATQCQPDANTVSADGEATGIMGLTSDEVALPDGDQVLELRARQQGTEMLSLRVGAHAQEHPTSLQKCTFSAALAVSPTTIFVQGCPVGSEKASLVLALGREGLGELWRAPIASGTEWDVDMFRWNGRALLVRASATVYALDAGTGATLWRIN